jgi:hypothetical protein
MRIPNKVPGKLSIRGGETPIFQGGKAAYNYAIGGLPFLSAASNQDFGKRKIRRATAPFRKQQTDDAVNPGEQSLDGYWLRSQVSFHGGAGLLYSDPSQSNPMSDIRFYRSKNIDPWTQGTVSLLSDTDDTSALSGTLELISITFGDGDPGVVGIRGTNHVYTKAVGDTAVDNTVATTVYSVTTDGAYVFVSANDGLYKGPVPTTSAGTITFTKIYTYTVTASSEVAWVKERLVLGKDSDLYELVPSPVGPPAALPAALYTAKPTGWAWTSISETSPAIYAVGSVGSVSSILKLTLETDGGIPTLAFGSVAATLPGGEVAHSVFGYLGTFLGIGTSKGARVAVSDADGNLSYGPLLFESSMPVLDFTGRDRWLWCSYSETDEDDIRLARIDLSVEIEELRFAWATDLCATNNANNTVTVAFYGASDVLAFATSDAFHEEDETHRASSGFLQTSRIRFSTLEPKVFRNLRVRGPVLMGALGISVIDTQGAVTPIYVYGVNTAPGEEDLNIPGPGQRDFLSFKFDFNSSVDETTGASMHGWQCKALPGSPRQRMVTLPLWCYDWEKDRNGQRVGGHRSAVRRLRDLEDLESTGQVVQWQDLDTDTASDVFIESMEFEQGDPPPRFEGWGGIILIQMRTV